MQMSDIFHLLKSYLALGIRAILFIGILFLAGYFLIYKKIMKGRKKINKKRLFLYGITICYIIVLLGAVFLNRGRGFFGNIDFGDLDFHLFTSYKEAYHKMKLSLFRNIILNILMFVPLGFLLPFYSDKLKKLYTTVPIGFFATLFIEMIQHIFKLGIFEMDDIFNNTLGTLIGYCIFMTGRRLKNKTYKKYHTLYFAPIFLIIATFLGIYLKYQNLELGNLEFEYNYTVNTKNVDIKSDVSFSTETQIMPIYYKKKLTETETKEIAKRIYEKLGTKINEDETILYEDTAIYNADGYGIWIDYIDGTYDYTDFSQFSNETRSSVKRSESRETIEKALDKLGIEIPESASFEEAEKDNLPYIFTVDMEVQGNELQNGTLRCSYYEDGTAKDIINRIITYNQAKEKEIISEELAYHEILNGHFEYSKAYMGRLENIVIKDVNIEYKLDSKGYYVPVYAFEAEINGAKTTIYIKAIKD